MMKHTSVPMVTISPLYASNDFVLFIVFTFLFLRVYIVAHKKIPLL
jgi:hypothetical protein